ASRRRALHGVDRALRGLAADLLGRALDALGQHVAETLPVGDHLQELVGALGVAPRELEPHLLLGEIALLQALHHPAAHPAELVHVHARAIDAGVEPGDRVLVGEPDGPARAGPALVLGLVHPLALVAALGNDLDVAVAHAAGVAL